MCGIFGVWNVRKAAELSVIGLHHIQHRAIDYAGIVSTDGFNMYAYRGTGLVRQVFDSMSLDRLHGRAALGHIRYPTVADDPKRENIQPVVGRYGGLPIALAHNGNITNLEYVHTLIPAHIKPATSMDSECILLLLDVFATGDIEADIARIAGLLEGSFSLGVLLPDRLIAVRDKSGNRPLAVARLADGYCISSENCAFPSVEAVQVTELAPGAMAVINSEGLRMRQFAVPEERKCRFEHIYFSHPASVVFGESVGRFRIRVGRLLEELFPVPGADIVTPIPFSSICMAMGFGESGRSGRYYPVITRNIFMGRSFIAASQADRDEKVANKFTFTADEIADRRLVVVDDSVVRNTTLPVIVKKLRRYGAREIHVRIGSPPIRYPCRYGINTPDQTKLIAFNHTPQQLCDRDGADSLEFLPLEALQSLAADPEHYCYACMDGTYW